ncbi:MAG: ABC transporter ATP-binding protein [Pseudomonadota bacterium]|nr:ABC transporter ATP-binding protein [Pseudomonadota bacterium]
MNILEVRGLEKSYPDPESDKELKAVDGISFTLEEVQIYGILGPNGAGKTTTLEMIEGLTDIDEGYAIVNGINVADDPYAVKEIIGVQLQSNEYFDSLSLKELLILFGKLYQNNVDAKSLLNKVDLLEKINSKPEELSGGQKQRFSIACALVNEPKVLFLDEPTTGLDPQAKHNLWELIKELNLSGMTIILTTHNMEEAENLCHKVAIMDKGKIIIEGNPEDLINKYDREDGNLENVFLSLTGKELRD